MATFVEARPASRATAGAGRRVGVALTYLVLLVLGLMFSFPFLWTLSSSLKTAHETQVLPPLLVPAVPQWVNYATVWTTQPIWRWILNSLIVIGLSVPGAVLSGIVVAYSFARFDYPGRGLLFMLLLSSQIGRASCRERV